MKNKKIVSCMVTFALALCLIFAGALTLTNANAKADGETYTLNFVTGTPSRNIARSVAGWSSESGGNNGHTADGTTATVDFVTASGTVYYRNAGDFDSVAGKSYLLSFEYKFVSVTDENPRGYFSVFNMGTKYNVIKGNVQAGDEWKTFAETFIAEVNGDRLVIQNPQKNSTISFRNMTVTELTSVTVTAGTAIGELPEIAEKTGYKGFWTVDGETIASDTLYNYGANKLATVEYKKANTLTLAKKTSGDVTDSLNGWRAEVSETEPTGITVADGVMTVDFVTAGGVAHFNNKAIDIVNGETYTLSIDYKKVSGKGYFHIWRSGWQLVRSNIPSSDAWQTYTAEFTATADGEGLMIQDPNVGTDPSVMQFRNLVIYQGTAKTVAEGEAIGELPLVDERTGYTGSWMIDGVAIGVDTVWNYAEDKTATVGYKANKYVLTLGDTTKEVTYDAPIGELPAISAPEGKTGVWKIGEDEITADTVWKYTEDKTATVTYVNVRYTVTAGEKTFDIAVGEIVGDKLPAVPERKGYDGVWTLDNEVITSETVWKKIGNVELTAEYTAKTYVLTIGETTLPVTYDKAVGELPEIPAQTGKTGVWKIDDDVITADTVWNYTEDKTAMASYTPNTYVLTIGETTLPVTYGEAMGELPACNGSVPEGYEAIWVIDGTPLTAETVWNYTENKTAEVGRKVITYTVTFKVDGVEVGRATYTVENKEITKPDINDFAKDGYTAEWENVELDHGDKVINAVYTKIEKKDNGCNGGIGGLGAVCLALIGLAFIKRKEK